MIRRFSPAWRRRQTWRFRRSRHRRSIFWRSVIRRSAVRHGRRLRRWRLAAGERGHRKLQLRHRHRVAAQAQRHPVGERAHRQSVPTCLRFAVARFRADWKTCRSPHRAAGESSPTALMSGRQQALRATRSWRRRISVTTPTLVRLLYQRPHPMTVFCVGIGRNARHRA
jgi:hypothetical protein